MEAKILKSNIDEEVEVDTTMAILCARDARIQELSTELDRVRAQLDRAKRTRLDILSNVSHELRTPITSIKAFCDMLLMFGDEDKEVREEFLQSIIEECDRLINMINEALDISKMESGKMEWIITDVNIAEVISASVNLIQGMLKTNGLALETKVNGDLPVIQGDRDKIMQVIVNLLSNAIKFTAEGQIILGAENGNNEVTVYVSDTGIGIEPEHQELIFEEFYQVGDILTDKPKGTGLGLSICLDIVTYHGGRIWVESEPGVGSTFYFTLPLEIEEQNERMI
ncbi:MAG: sensor histidine kinase [Candidatus Poribacteria bacterium]